MTFANLHIVDWAVVLAYMVLIFYVGAKFTKKAGENITGFFLSGRSLPWWLAGTSVVAGHFSASQPVNVITAIRNYGIEHLWFQWYTIPACMFAGIFVAKMWQRSRIITSVEIIRLRFSGVGVHFLTVFQTLYHNTFIRCYFTAASFIALEKIIGVMLPGVNPLIIIFVMCLLALTYSMMSGLYAVVVTDFIQFIFASIGSIVLVLLIYSHVGSPRRLLEEATAVPGKETITYIMPASPPAAASHVERIYLYKTPITDAEAMKKVEDFLVAEGVGYKTLVDKYIVLESADRACELRTALKDQGLQPKSFKAWSALGLDNWGQSIFIDKGQYKSRTDTARMELGEALRAHLRSLDGVEDASVKLQASPDAEGVVDDDANATQLVVELLLADGQTEKNTEAQAWSDTLAVDLGVEAVLTVVDELEFATEVPSLVNANVKAWLDYIGILLYFFVLWGLHGEMTYGGADPQRMMATRSERDSMLTVIWANIIERGIVFWLWIIIALGSLVMLGGDAYDSQKAFAEMGLKFLPIGLKGVFVAAIFAALMSTIDTNINMTSSVLVNDLYKNYFRKNESDAHYVFVARLCTALALFLSFAMWALLLSGTSILDNWKTIGMLMVGAGSGLFTWIWWRVNAWSFVATMVASPFCTIMIKSVLPKHFEWFATYNLGTDYWAIGVFVTNIFTLICWVSVTLLTKPTDMECLKEFYRRVRPPGFWGPVKEALGDEVVAPPSDVKTDFITWILAIIVVFTFIFGLGKLMLGSYLYGIVLMTIFGVALYFMLKLINQAEGYVKEQKAES